jgi:hypothetical protein
MQYCTRNEDPSEFVSDQQLANNIPDFKFPNCRQPQNPNFASRNANFAIDVFIDATLPIPRPTLLCCAPSPSCLSVPLDRFFLMAKRMMPIYGALHFIPAVVFRRKAFAQDRVRRKKVKRGRKASTRCGPANRVAEMLESFPIFGVGPTERALSMLKARCEVAKDYARLFSKSTGFREALRCTQKNSDEHWSTPISLSMEHSYVPGDHRRPFLDKSKVYFVWNTHSNHSLGTDILHGIDDG